MRNSVEQEQTILNRPYIEGKPVEGPEPFLPMDLAEGIAIGLVDVRFGASRGPENITLSVQDYEALYDLRQRYPVDFVSEFQNPDFKFPEHIERIRKRRMIYNNVPFLWVIEGAISKMRSRSE